MNHRSRTQLVVFCAPMVCLVILFRRGLEHRRGSDMPFFFLFFLFLSVILLRKPITRKTWQLKLPNSLTHPERLDM